MESNSWKSKVKVSLSYKYIYSYISQVSTWVEKWPSDEDRIPAYSYKWGPWDWAVGWLKQQLKLMTGGRKHCWQQQQHVIWEWNASSRLILNPNLWSEIAMLLMKQYDQSRAVCKGSILNRCTGWHKGWPSLYDSSFCQRRGRLFPMWPHLSTEDFLILMQACCCWHVAGSFADFVSLPGLLLDTVSVRDINVRVSVWACQDLLMLHLWMCMWTCMASHLFVLVWESCILCEKI